MSLLLLGSRAVARSPGRFFTIPTQKRSWDHVLRKVSSSSSWHQSQLDKIVAGVNDCPKDCLCSRNIEADYKNVRLLSQFVSQQTGMILPRTVTKVCLTKQRTIAKEIKKAVQMGFMPANHKLPAYLDDPKLF